jgi:mannose-1-phosphate guanylyltransferase
MTHAVIMAGGRGERFWPKSRQCLPKQFLKLIGDQTMLQRTVSRMERFLAPENIYIITAASHQQIVRHQVPEIPEGNIILEPCGRDTAAAIGLAAVIVQQKDAAGVMVVLPADHYIADEDRFLEVLRGAVDAAEENHTVTIGITANRPETGFGYIARGQYYQNFAGIPSYHVKRFTEKPDRQQAVGFLESGNYFWNSGIFVWRADVIRHLIGEHLPSLAEGLEKIEEVAGTTRYPQVLQEVYVRLPRISIDYGVMEKAREVLVIPGDFGWDDVGSWTALESYKEKDINGNIKEGRGVLVDTTNTLVQNSDKVVATLGVHDLIVVESEGSILICHKQKAQELKKVITALQENGYKEIL